MSDALSAFLERYGATAVGLVLGTAARYGMMLTEGRRPRRANLLADVLLWGMLGLIAHTVGNVVVLFGLALSSDARVLSAALAAVGSDRLVRLVADRYFRRIEETLPGAPPEDPR